MLQLRLVPAPGATQHGARAGGRDVLESACRRCGPLSIHARPRSLTEVAIAIGWRFRRRYSRRSGLALSPPPRVLSALCCSNPLAAFCPGSTVGWPRGVVVVGLERSQWGVAASGRRASTPRQGSLNSRSPIPDVEAASGGPQIVAPKRESVWRPAGLRRLGR